MTSFVSVGLASNLLHPWMPQAQLRACSPGHDRNLGWPSGRCGPLSSAGSLLSGPPSPRATSTGSSKVPCRRKTLPLFGNVTRYTLPSAGVLLHRLTKRPRRHLTVERQSLVCCSSSSDSSSRVLSGAAETDKLPGNIRDAVLIAVERLGGRVTVGDVAATAGVKLVEAERALKALALDADGCLEVSDEGDVLYVFRADLRSRLLQRSLRMRAAPILKKARDVGSYVARVSFGTALLVSVAVVYTAIAVLLSSRSDSDNRNERGGYQPRYYSGPAFYFDLSDIFWYWDPFYYRRLRRELGTREMSFLESVFSFVFGDGDPNEGLDELRWKAIGDTIARKGGVVAAEELAPFLDIPSDFREDEAYMIPVLQRLDGTPTVDEQGNILYRFPSLQRTAKDWLGNPRVLTGDEAAPPPAATLPWEGWWSGAGQQPGAREERGPPLRQSLMYFAQNLWSFSSAPRYKLFLAAGLGVANLVGVAFLSNLTSDPMVVRQAGSGFVNSVVNFLPLVQVYAGAFFAIPAVRWFLQQRRNERISRQNLLREESALLLSRPSAPLRRKLVNAREQADRTVLGPERVVYTTAKDMDEQQLDARDWEKRLGEKAG